MAERVAIQLGESTKKNTRPATAGGRDRGLIASTRRRDRCPFVWASRTDRHSLLVTNTFPVDVNRGELPSSEMYMSGRSLLPLSLALDLSLSREFDGGLPISFSGGVDAFKVKEILSTGIQPVTVATTILKPGGVTRLKQLSGMAAEVVTDYHGIDVDRLAALVDNVLSDERYHKRYREKIRSRKTDSPLPLTDCYKAPCEDGGCPFKRFYTSEHQRRAAMPAWIHEYNHHRTHTAIGKATPISRLTEPGWSVHLARDRHTTPNLAQVRPVIDPFATKTPRGRFGVAAAPAGRPVTASGRLVPSGPERIDLGLLGVGSPDLLYSTSAHENYLVARRVQCQAVVLTRRAMDGDDVLLGDGDVYELGAKRAVRQRSQECEKLISDLWPANPDSGVDVATRLMPHSIAGEALFQFFHVTGGQSGVCAANDFDI